MNNDDSPLGAIPLLAAGYNSKQSFECTVDSSNQRVLRASNIIGESSELKCRNSQNFEHARKRHAFPTNRSKLRGTIRSKSFECTIDPEGSICIRPCDFSIKKLNRALVVLLLGIRADPAQFLLRNLAEHIPGDFERAHDASVLIALLAHEPVLKLVCETQQSAVTLG